MTQYNMNPEIIKKALENNKHNNATTTYYLLLNKFILQGRKDLVEPNKCFDKNTNKELIHQTYDEKIKSLGKQNMIYEDINSNDNPEVETHYQKRAEFCHRKRPKDFTITQRRKVANNRRGLPQTNMQKEKHNKTVIKSDEDYDTKNLSFDVFADIIEKKMPSDIVKDHGIKARARPLLYGDTNERLINTEENYYSSNYANNNDKIKDLNKTAYDQIQNTFLDKANNKNDEILMSVINNKEISDNKLDANSFIQTPVFTKPHPPPPLKENIEIVHFRRRKYIMNRHKN